MCLSNTFFYFTNNFLCLFHNFLLQKYVLFYIIFIKEMKIMDLKEMGLRIRNRRKQLHMTQDELCKKVSYQDRATISKIETGHIDIPQSAIVELANALKVSPLYILGVEELDKPVQNLMPLQLQKVKVLGDIACGQPIFSEETEEYAEIGGDIKADFCLICKGDSMIGARILDGDIVFIKSQSIVNNGEIGAVIIDGEATLKRVYYYPEKNKLVLQSENPAYEPFVYVGDELNNINIIGKAIAFQSKIK